MGIREIIINNYVKNGDTFAITINLTRMLIIYILLLIMKMSLNDRTIYYLSTWEVNIWCFCVGFINGLIGNLVIPATNNYIWGIIREREVQELYLKNMRKRELTESKKALEDMKSLIYKPTCSSHEENVLKMERNRIILDQFNSFRI